MTDAADTPQGQQQALPQQPQPQQSQGAPAVLTTVMRSGDTAVGQQQQLRQRRSREAVAAELYNTSLRYFKAEDDYPTLTQNLREYLQAQKQTTLAAAVSDECSVEEYLQRPAAFCADEQVCQRIDAMPGMRVADGLHLLWQARFGIVGDWADAEEPKQVAGMSDETYEIVKQAVRAATARAAQRRHVESAGAKDEYGQTCKQLLPASVGKALYKSVRDATWGALGYVTGAAEGRVPFADDTDSETALPASVDDRGMKHANDDAHDAQEARRDKVVLHTLYSQRGWPMMWRSDDEEFDADDGAPVAVPVPPANERKALADDVASRMLLVRYEMQRAWQRVVLYYNSINTTDTLDTLPRDKQPFIPPPRQADGVRGRVLSSIRAMRRMAAALVVGTPGIGKTMSGNYMVYRLLHDANAPRYVVFAVANYVHVFDKQRECVSCYERADFKRNAFYTVHRRQCVYIHDCSEAKYQLGADSFFGVALLIVLSSPNKNNYAKLVSKTMSKAGVLRVVMHSWSYCELSCYARLVGLDDKTLQERVSRVGPLPRYVLDDADAYVDRVQAVDEKIKECIDKFDPYQARSAEALLSVGRDAVSPTNTLYDMRRDDAQRAQQHDTPHDAANVIIYDIHTYRLLTRNMHQRLLTGVLSMLKDNKDSFVAAIASFISQPQSYEEITCATVATRLFWRTLCVYSTPGLTLRCLGSATATAAPLTQQCVEQWLEQGIADVDEHGLQHKERCYFGRNEQVSVFWPRRSNFVYLDAFLLLRCNDDIHFVGVQATRDKDHKTTHNKIQSFFAHLPPLTIELREVEKENMRRRKHEGPTAAVAATTPQQDTERADDAAATQRRSNAATVDGSRASDKWVYTTPEDKLALFTHGVATCSVIYVSDTMHPTQRLPLRDIPTDADGKCISDDYTTFYDNAKQYLVHVTAAKMLEAKKSRARATATTRRRGIAKGRTPPAPRRAQKRTRRTSVRGKHKARRA